MVAQHFSSIGSTSRVYCVIFFSNKLMQYGIRLNPDIAATMMSCEEEYDVPIFSIEYEKA